MHVPSHPYFYTIIKLQSSHFIQYNFKYGDHSTPADIDANITAEELQALIVQTFDEGQIAVERTGSCASYTWDITWQTVGGTKPHIEVRTLWSGNYYAIRGKDIVVC